MQQLKEKIKKFVLRNLKRIFVYGTTLFTLLVALLVASLLAIWSQNPLNMWTILATVGLVLSSLINYLMLMSVRQGIKKSKDQYDAANAEMQQLLQGLLVATSTRTQAIIDASEERISATIEKKAKSGK